MELKKYREKAGLSLVNLSAETGISVDYLCKIEAGEVLARDVSDADALALAQVLGVPLNDLVGCILLDNGSIVHLDEFEWFKGK